MGWKESNNNRILPANARAADVAERMVEHIIPTEQRRQYDAFRIQGVTCVHFNRLTSGRKCNCKSSEKQLGGLLDEKGKASEGTINSLITGQPQMSFNITPYNQNQQRVTGYNNGQTSPQAPVNKNQGVFDVKTTGEDFPLADIIIEDDFGDNGPVSPFTIDDMVGDFNASTMGFSDVACPICFGTGFVGGFAPFHAHRQVFTVADVQLPLTGQIQLEELPWTATTSTGFSVLVTLPRGAIGVDAFRVWNSADPVPASFSIDSQPLTGITSLLAFCDGRPHVLTASFSGKFTHLELQFNLTTESVYFEFPKRPGSADTSLLEQMEPFQIILSPNLPAINSMDVIVESQLGKVLVVQNINPWRSRLQNVLGWEVQVRVIQPMELFRILPHRGRIANKDRTTQMVRDNVTGPRRT